ncbi:hypothetical protein D3C80_2207100 [compost metagenome]
MADAIAARDTARGVWACMSLIDNADLAIKRFYPQVMADRVGASLLAMEYQSTPM